MKSKPQIDMVVLDVVRRMTAEGKPAHAIALRLNCSSRTVQRYRKMLQLSPPPVVAREPEVRAEVKRLLDDGTSSREAARTVGVSDSTVKRWFPGAGWRLTEAGKHAALLKRSGPMG